MINEGYYNHEHKDKPCPTCRGAGWTPDAYEERPEVTIFNRPCRGCGGEGTKMSWARVHHMEEFRPIEGFPGYSITSFGRVMSSKRGSWREKRLVQKPKGSMRTCLFINAKGHFKYVHILVLEAFGGPRPDGEVARHWNGKNDDNHRSNLLWGTPYENEDDKKRTGRVGYERY